MKRKLIVNSACVGLLAIMLFTSCKSHYQVVNIVGSKQFIDKRFDKNPDAITTAIVDRYKYKVDSLMSPVIGYNDVNMKSGRPESLLSDCASDMLLNGARKYDPSVSVAVTNIGGLRSPLYKGTLTIRSIFEVFPFQNTLCLMTLNGKDLRQLMREIAIRFGEGISGINIVITPDSQLVSAKIKGVDIDDNTSYRVATLDYLAEGNDGMVSFQKGTNLVYPDGARIRDLMLDYVRELTAKGEHLSVKLDGRITVKK